MSVAQRDEACKLPSAIGLWGKKGKFIRLTGRDARVLKQTVTRRVSEGGREWTSSR